MPLLLQRRQKPAYIEICCNLAGLADNSFVDPPIPFAIAFGHTNERSLKAAVDATVKVRADVVVHGCVAGIAALLATSGCFVCHLAATTVLQTYLRGKHQMMPLPVWHCHFCDHNGDQISLVRPQSCCA